MLVFVDTGTNVNTMSRRQFVAFLHENLRLDVKLVDGKTLHVAGSSRTQPARVTFGYIVNCDLAISKC